MNNAKTKKVYVFILEGWSDKEALEGLLKRIYKNKNILPLVMNGDITSDYSVNINDICKKISNLITQKIKEEKLKKSDIVNIFQIVDTDGAFVPDSALVQGTTKDFIYSETRIEVPNIDKAKERNSHKSKALSHLLSNTSISNIPYRLFYMSCNLDHVLYDIQNLDDNLKTAKADEFFEKYRNSPENLIEYLKKCSFDVPSNYMESWEFISKDLHSLERHNNLFILFQEHPPFAC